ncbi:hypothetical protein R3P38DRAFT_3275467 [Favolaschia claudopus]|uniref:Uncharacterized protein n=1 Tax=Favolaschia claudopus TaxID=2862362 RepID=A0AAW0AU35_9AGAR
MRILTRTSAHDSHDPPTFTSTSPHSPLASPIASPLRLFFRALAGLSLTRLSPRVSPLQRRLRPPFSTNQLTTPLSALLTADAEADRSDAYKLRKMSATTSVTRTTHLPRRYSNISPLPPFSSQTSLPLSPRVAVANLREADADPLPHFALFAQSLSPLGLVSPSSRVNTYATLDSDPTHRRRCPVLATAMTDWSARRLTCSKAAVKEPSCLG